MRTFEVNPVKSSAHSTVIIIISTLFPNGILFTNSESLIYPPPPRIAYIILYILSSFPKCYDETNYN